MLLAGDVGGTKTTLGVFSSDEGPKVPLKEGILVSSDFESLHHLCREFLAGTDYEIRHACFGVPGPVVGGRCTTTNLSWEIDQERLTEALGLERVTLINDLEAVAYSLTCLESKELKTICPAEGHSTGTVAIVAPGTGLGEAFATHGPEGYTAHPSEGGHADFAPTTDLEEGLLSFLRKKHEHVSYERVCSGMGLPNIYDYLKTIGYIEEGWLASELAEATDRTPVIVNAALDPTRSSDLCSKTLEVFVSILGSVSGNLALTAMATGGVYLGGGIPPRILPALSNGTYAEAFHRKGRLRPLLQSIPVQVILNPEAGFMGAAARGLALG